MTEEPAKLRWGLIGLVTLTGIALTGLPFVLSAVDHDKFGDRHALTSSTLTNIGTTLLLAALLFGLERTFLKRVTKATAASVEAAVDERTRHFEEESQRLASKLEDLTAQVQERIAAEAAQRGASIAKIAADVTFDTVAEAMEQANDLSALWHGVITVPGNGTPTAPKVMFDWRPQELEDEKGQRRIYSPLRLIVEVYDQRSNRHVHAAEVLWWRGEAVTEAMSSIRKELMKAGRGADGRAIDDTYLFTMFQRAIDLAIEERQGYEDFWVHGPIDELITEDLAVTSQGLSIRGHALLASTDFPAPQSFGGIKIRKELSVERPPFPPPAPEGISEEQWTAALKQAQRSHPFRGYSGMFGSASVGFEPYTTETSPRDT